MNKLETALVSAFAGLCFVMGAKECSGEIKPTKMCEKEIDRKLLDSRYLNAEGHIFLREDFDCNNDGKKDYRELRYVYNGMPLFYPVMYWFDYNKNNEVDLWELIEDFNMDGLNGNEIMPYKHEA